MLHDIAGDLDVLCTSACGGGLSTLFSTCGIEGRNTAYLLTVACLRRPDNEYCAQYLPTLLFSTDFDTAAQTCMNYEPGMDCPADCAEPLGRVIEELGCCYRSLYGNRDVMERFPDLYSQHSEGVRNVFDMLLAGSILNLVTFNITLHVLVLVLEALTAESVHRMKLKLMF